MEHIADSRLQRMWEGIKKAWYKFSRNPLSVVGAVSVLLVFFLLTFAPISPRILSMPVILSISVKRVNRPA